MRLGVAARASMTHAAETLLRRARGEAHHQLEATSPNATHGFHTWMAVQLSDAGMQVALCESRAVSRVGAACLGECLCLTFDSCGIGANARCCWSRCSASVPLLGGHVLSAARPRNEIEAHPLEVYEPYVSNSSAESMRFGCDRVCVASAAAASCRPSRRVANANA
jgi:hypothetical protein